MAHLHLLTHVVNRRKVVTHIDEYTHYRCTPVLHFCVCIQTYTICMHYTILCILCVCQCLCWLLSPFLLLTEAKMITKLRKMDFHKNWFFLRLDFRYNGLTLDLLCSPPRMTLSSHLHLYSPGITGGGQHTGIYVMLGIAPGALCMLDKCSINWVTSPGHRLILKDIVRDNIMYKQTIAYPWGENITAVSKLRRFTKKDERRQEYSCRYWITCFVTTSKAS